MGVALGGAELCVAEQPPDHFQRGAPGDQQRGEGVAQIMNADAGEIGLHAHPRPESLEIDDWLTGHLAEEWEGAAFGYRIPAKTDQDDSLMRDRHMVDAPLLCVGSLLGPDCQVEIELIEGGCAGLAAAGAGQHAQPDDPGGALIRIGTEDIGESLDFIKGEEALAGGFGTLAKAGGRIVGRHFAPHPYQKVALAKRPLNHVAICCIQAFSGGWAG